VRVREVPIDRWRLIAGSLIGPSGLSGHLPNNGEEDFQHGQ